MTNGNIQINATVTALIKITGKIEQTAGDDVSLDSILDAISVNDLAKLKEIVMIFEEMDHDDRQILFIQLVSSITSSVNEDLDKRNVAALIHLKVTLLKVLGYTLSIITILSVGIGMYTGNGNILPTLKESWKVIETMFLK